MKRVLSRRCLELLAGKLVALPIDFSFEFIKIDRLGVPYCIFQQPSRVDLLEDDRILYEILG
jgi:hypothetical protein